MMTIYRTEQGPDQTVACIVDLVYSPDDGGWYAHETRFWPEKVDRVSRRVFPTKRDLVRDLDHGSHRWTAHGSR